MQVRSDYRMAITAGSSQGSKTSAATRRGARSPETLRRPSAPVGHLRNARAARLRPDRGMLAALQLPRCAADVSGAVARELLRGASGRAWRTPRRTAEAGRRGEAWTASSAISSRLANERCSAISWVVPRSDLVICARAAVEPGVTSTMTARLTRSGLVAASRISVSPPSDMPMTPEAAGARSLISQRRVTSPAKRGPALGLPAGFPIEPDGRVREAKYSRHASDRWSVDDLIRYMGLDPTWLI